MTPGWPSTGESPDHTGNAKNSLFYLASGTESCETVNSGFSVKKGGSFLSCFTQLYFKI